MMQKTDLINFETLVIQKSRSLRCGSLSQEKTLVQTNDYAQILPISHQNVIWPDR